MKRTFAAASLALALTVCLAGPRLHAEQLTLVDVPVELRASVRIDADVVRLGDLFSGLDAKADTPIARAPQPGERVELSARWLASLATAYDIDWRPRTQLDRIALERRARILDAPLVEEMLRDAFLAAGDSGELAIALDNRNLVLHLPTDADAQPRLIGLSRNARSGRFHATLVYPDKGTPQIRAELSGQATEMVEVPVPIRRITASEVIGAQDIAWTSVRADRLSHDAVVDAAQMIGKSPRRGLTADRPLRISDLREPVLVDKNGLVLIRLRTDTMQITAQGRALEEGAAGNAIRVMNTKSNTVINAVVSDVGIVDVTTAASTLAAN
jgi:flagella basal body P-ring formation protein FlgA